MKNKIQYPKYLAKKHSVFQKISNLVDKFKGVGVQYKLSVIKKSKRRE